MINLFQKLARRAREDGTIFEEKQLRSLISEVKVKTDRTIIDRSRVSLILTPAEPPSWGVSWTVNEKSRFQTRPVKREHECVRIYDLVYDVERREPYSRPYHRGKIKSSFHFPLIVEDKVIGELVIYMRKSLDEGITQRLHQIATEHVKNLLETALAAYHTRTQ